MSLFSILGAIEIGLIFSLVALGVFISFRLLRFPDLTVDGKPVLELPVMALEEVPQASIFGRAWDSMRLWLK